MCAISAFLYAMICIILTCWIRKLLNWQWCAIHLNHYINLHPCFLSLDCLKESFQWSLIQLGCSTFSLKSTQFWHWLVWVWLILTVLIKQRFLTFYAVCVKINILISTFRIWKKKVFNKFFLLQLQWVKYADADWTLN